MGNTHNKKVKTDQVKQRRKIITWIAMSLVVVLLAVLPMLAAGKDASDEHQASILSGTVEYQDIDTKIIGGGRLASEAAIKLKIPEEVKLTEYLVGNGDIVSDGDPIAKVDRVSVMTAITKVQETLDYLSEQILDAGNDETPTAVKATVGGTVKVIYAQNGDSVQDVMLEHGALAAISLDDVMAVQIRRKTSLDVGDAVTVAFMDGTEVTGRVSGNLEDVLTVTVEDEGYPVGAEVIVTTEDGDRLGKGNLYIYNQWNATAYAGTVSKILVSEGASLRARQSIMQVEDSGHTAEFQRLIDKRQEYEELMQELFQMYRTETITAPCDGIVSGVDKNGAFLLSDSGESWSAKLLSNLTKRDGFVAYGVKVVEVSDDTMEIKVGKKQTAVEDLSDLASVAVNPGKLNQKWNYEGDQTVYSQSEDGVLRADGTAQAGDVLLAVGNADGVLWLVRTEPGEDTADVMEKPSVILLSASSDNADSGITLHLSNNQGTVKEPFSAVLTAMQGHNSVSGVWSIDYKNSAAWLSVSENVLSGVPAEAGTYLVTVGFVPDSMETVVVQEFTISIAAPAQAQYVGITAVVTDVSDGVLLVKQSDETIAIADPEHLPEMEFDLEKMTTPASYLSNLIKAKDIAKDDILLLVLDERGELIRYVKLSPEGESGNMSGGGAGFPGGGVPSMGGMPSAGGMFGGMIQQEEDNLYTLEKLTVASVTSQEQMTVEVTIDELDITRIYVGQTATVTMEALTGESFAAVVTRISNIGENEGGNSKFTVELTLEKNGDMLPGMTASAVIVLHTEEKAITIPAAALNGENGEMYVYTAYDAEKDILGSPVAVTIGAADAENVQILSGLKVGDKFYYAYFDKLPDER